MIRSKTLRLEHLGSLEHELFRACMQIVVGVEQGHSDQALKQYAKTLRELSHKHIHWSEFE